MSSFWNERNKERLVHDAYVKEKDKKLFDDLFGPIDGAASSASPSRVDIPSDDCHIYCSNASDNDGPDNCPSLSGGDLPDEHIKVIEAACERSKSDTQRAIHESYKNDLSPLTPE